MDQTHTTHSPILQMLIDAIPAQAFREITVDFWKGVPTNLTVKTHPSLDDTATPTAHQQIQAEATKAKLLATGFMEALAQSPFWGSTISLRPEDASIRVGDDHNAHATSLDLVLIHDGHGQALFFHLEHHQYLPLSAYSNEPIITRILAPALKITPPLEHLSRLFAFLSNMQGPFYAWQRDTRWGTRTFTAPLEPTAQERLGYLCTDSSTFIQEGAFPTPAHPLTITPYHPRKSRMW